MTSAGLRAVVLAAAAVPLGCHDAAPPDPPPPAEVAFLFGMKDDATGVENFVAVTSDPAVIARVRAELALAPEQRTLHIHGPIARGNGGRNLDWSWHFVPGDWDVVEISIELCDGRPADVESDLDYWIDTVGAFCPWGSRALDELAVPASAAW